MEIPEPAQICRKGHIVNEIAEFNPGANRKFCPQCGAETLLACENCNEKITSADTSLGVRDFVRPAYCHACSKPFPWTQFVIQTAGEFADSLETLDINERSELKAVVPDLIIDTPRSPLAVSRIKELTTKIGKPATQAFMQILVSVLTEETKRQLGLH